MASLVNWLAYAGARKTDGTPVASGTAYFFQPGTVSTQEVVYSDADGLSAITQPVTLDAGGRAVVYTKTPCRISVRDSLGNLIRVEDKSNTVMAAQIESANAGFSGTDVNAILTALAASTLGTNAKYKESSTATERLLYKAIGNWVTPEDFGALGDDANDDTTGVQAAFNRAVASGKGVLLTGIYRVTGISVTAAAGLHVVGSTRKAAIIKNMSTSASAITVAVTDTAAESHLLFENFKIAANTYSTGKGLYITGGQGARVVGVSVAGHRESFLAGDQATVESCVVESTDSTGTTNSIGFNGQFRSTFIKCRATVSTAGYGFYLQDQCRAYHCVATTSSGVGFTSEPSGDDVVMHDCVASTNTVGFDLLSGARSGCIRCVSTNGATADFRTSASLTSAVDLGNSFTTRVYSEVAGNYLSERCPVRGKYKSSTSTDTALIFTPDPAYAVNVLAWAGTLATAVSIANTITTGLLNGQEMVTVTENSSANAVAITLSFGTQYKGAGGVATIAQNTYQIITWSWSTLGSKWILVDYHTALATGGSAIW